MSTAAYPKPLYVGRKKFRSKYNLPEPFDQDLILRKGCSPKASRGSAPRNPGLGIGTPLGCVSRHGSELSHKRFLPMPGMWLSTSDPYG